MRVYSSAVSIHAFKNYTHVPIHYALAFSDKLVKWQVEARLDELMAKQQELSKQEENELTLLLQETDTKY